MTGLRSTTADAPTRWRDAAAGVGLAVIVMLAGCGDDDDSNADSDPAGVVEAYRDTYNTGDIDGVMALFSEESVVSNHPFAREATGLDEIRELHVTDMGRAAEDDAYEFSNVEVSDDTVTWDHVWTNDGGTDWCAEGHSAVIADGKILTWTFADPHRCR